MINGAHLNYNKLRKIDAESARVITLEILKSNNNISKTARILNTSRHTIYKCTRKSKLNNLKDSSKAPKQVQN